MDIKQGTTSLITDLSHGVSKLSTGVQNVTQQFIPSHHFLVTPTVDIHELLKTQIDLHASDLHLISNEKPRVRSANGTIKTLNLPVIKHEDLESVLKYLLTEEGRWDHFIQDKEIDIAVNFEDIGRFRLNVYRERHGLGMVFRQLPGNAPTIEDVGIQNTIIPSLALKNHGLVLVTGQNDSGKTTTISAMIDYINRNKEKHILILEDPIEIIHKPILSMISHREVGKHTNNYAESIRHALRQDIDVVVIGEMRDFETISAAIETAEAGYLVLGTLHTSNAVESIQRIISVYAKNQQSFVQHQLSTILKGVVSQKLLPRADGKGRVMCREIMIPNDAISHLIRAGEYSKIHQMMEIMQKEGNQTFDGNLLHLYTENLISYETCMTHAKNKDWIERKMSGVTIE